MKLHGANGFDPQYSEYFLNRNLQPANSRFLTHRKLCFDDQVQLHGPLPDPDPLRRQRDLSGGRCRDSNPRHPESEVAADPADASVEVRHLEALAGAGRVVVRNAEAEAGVANLHGNALQD